MEKVKQTIGTVSYFGFVIVAIYLMKQIFYVNQLRRAYKFRELYSLVYSNPGSLLWSTNPSGNIIILGFAILLAILFVVVMVIAPNKSFQKISFFTFLLIIFEGFCIIGILNEIQTGLPMVGNGNTELAHKANKIVNSHMKSYTITANHFQQMDGTTFKVNDETYQATSRKNVIRDYTATSGSKRQIKISWKETKTPKYIRAFANNDNSYRINKVDNDSLIVVIKQ